MLNKSELIKALIKELKIDNNIFNYEAINEEIEAVKEENYLDFYKDVMKSESYGSGMKSIMKTADKYKPFVVDKTTDKAKTLISIVETINAQISEDAKRMGEDFVKLVNLVSLPNVSENTIRILDNVKPYYNHKSLIINIRRYQTSVDALEAFKSAIKIKKESLAILNTRVEKMVEKIA